jgi:hypothetical protein
MALLNDGQVINHIFVGLENLLKLSNRGIPRASAQWMCANAGGLEIIASATNVRPVEGHGE